MSDDNPMPPGSFGCHEVLHMTSFFASAIEAEIIDHPAIRDNEEWAMLAQKAQDALVDLYQKIGNAHLAAEQVMDTTHSSKTTA